MSSRLISTNIAHEGPLHAAGFFRFGRHTQLYQPVQSDPAAGRVITLIEKIAKHLGDFPESGQHTDELDTRIAFSPRYPYRIYYRIVANEVVILHIRHAARRPIEPGDI